MGFLNPIKLISQVALAALTGGASLTSLLGSQILGKFSLNLIQNIGQQLGLPQKAIDMAQAKFCAACGDRQGVINELREAKGNGLMNINYMADKLTKEAGVSPFASGGVLRAVDQSSSAGDSVSKMIMDGITKQNVDRANGKDGTSSEEIDAIMNGKGSILMKLAIVLGKLADNKMNQMADTAKQLGKFGEVDNKNSGQYQELTGKMNALGQETSILSNAMSNVLKTLGEAATTIARK